MRTRFSVLTLVLVVSLSACTQSPRPVRTLQPRAQTTPATQTSAELLVLGTDSGEATIDPATGTVRFDGQGVPALADWSKLYSATRDGNGTVLKAVRPDTGAMTSTLRIPGDLAIRAVSGDGQKVALMAPLPHGQTPWDPRPRASTTLVVADTTGQSPPARMRLKGNFEPEAFANDDASLFMIQYLPATDPVAYRVVNLDLTHRKVFPVYGREKSPVETMTGTRLIQTPSPDGTTLYTLYTSQPPAYAREYTPAQAQAGRPVAFIHTLSLHEGWAHCIGLPKPLWGGDPTHEALAVALSNGPVYVVDTARGVVASMNTNDLTIERTTRVSFGAPSHAQAKAAVSSDGLTLFVANGSQLVAIDTTSLRPRLRWTAAGPVRGLGTGADGLHLYAAMQDEVAVMDPSTGRETGMIPAPATNEIRYVGTLAA